MQKEVFDRLFEKVQHGYFLKESPDGPVAVCSPLLARDGLRHAFSSRLGGISKGPYESMNLSLKHPEDREDGEKNYRLFCAAFGFSYDSLCTIHYEHGTTVLPVTRKDRGKGFPGEALLPFCDGLVTDDPEVTLVSSHADCGALFFYDPVKRACGMTHAGWRGTLGRIGEETVKVMRETYGSNPSDLLAVVGPCIGKENYEVDLPLAQRFLAEFENTDIFSPGKPDKAYLDLKLAAVIQLLEAGIPPENISCMDLCTFNEEKLFFSHRRDRGITGSMSGFIQLF